MANQSKTITLENEHHGPRVFDFAHAERLVALEHKIKSYNWAPAKGSKFNLIDGALIPGRHQAETQAAEEQG